MRFEQALQAMREGKKVKRPTQGHARAIRLNMIVEVFKWNPREKEINDWYEPLDGINCDNILAEDWEIVEDEPQS
jgi:hypothetical protein